MPNNSHIPLYRSGKQVDSLLSAFGGMRETRLTAALGYLVSKLPSVFESRFVMGRERICKVIIEEHDELGRTDLVLECTETVVIIEAKVGIQQSIPQIKKYLNAYSKKKKRLELLLLDSGSERNTVVTEIIQDKLGRKTPVGFCTWQEIYDICKRSAELQSNIDRDRFAAAALDDYAKHLEEADMAGNKKREIYVRDLSGPSLKLFLDRNIYKCQPQFYESASTTSYFAPYFTKVAPTDLKQYSIINIEPGISYVSKIIKCDLVRRNAVYDYLKENDWPNAKETSADIIKGHTLKEITVFLLSKPYRFLITPVTKNRIGIYGTMGARFFTFEDMFKAASKGGV